jgi:DNA polymerase
MNQETKQWEYVDTYGGKITENIVQAIARDLLADAMREMDSQDIDIVMHVHDEAVAESLESEADKTLELMCDIMSKGLPWAEGLPLGAEGYVTPYYKKD